MQDCPGPKDYAILAKSKHGGPRAETSLTVEPSCKDEARVGQKGSLSYVWSPVGSRPPMVRDNRHDTAYIFGAICPARGVGAAVITPAANTECMNLHLAEISTQVAPGSIAALVCDGAGWHQSSDELKWLLWRYLLIWSEADSPEYQRGWRSGLAQRLQGSAPAEIIGKVLGCHAVESTHPFLETPVIGIDVVDVKVGSLCVWFAGHW